MKTTTQKEDSRPVHVWTDHVEASAQKQIDDLARLPFLHPHGVAIMPDVHMGIGASVGTVIATQSAIIPAAVGVDIGCGMNAVQTSLRAKDLPDSLQSLRHNIERGVPLGPGGAHRPGSHVPEMSTDLSARLLRVASEARMSTKNVEWQLGTLGSGNHFIELCIDERGFVWVVLHSGSRGAGNMLGRHYIERAKRRMEQWFITLPNVDLAYFPEDTLDFQQYVEAVSWAQDYAFENRAAMMATVLRALKHGMPPFTIEQEAINCHHNYVAMENHYGRNVYVTRKGAIRAREGDLGVIPGSMGTRSYIVRGKGNPESYCSCSHGAGRVMSRTQAAKSFTVDDLKRETAGVECRKDASVLDELPSAYKDIDVVMEHQKDLVEIKHVLKQVLCVKGN